MDALRPAQLVRIEARALNALADRLEGAMAAAFARAVDFVVRCGQGRGRVVVTGMGKSGIIAQKIAATLNSTGSPALFLHPAEALHGDLGMLAKGDVVIALSSSGETEEILRLLPTLKRTGDALISFCCELGSTLALGDALAVAVSLKKGFRQENFADLHPGGKLGKKLARVRELMHTDAAIPQVEQTTPMPEVIYEMSRKGLGMTVVTDGEMLAGLISDGDLRRLLERKGPEALAMCAGEAMNPAPKTIAPQEFAARALSLMEENKITALVVIEEGKRIAGVLHLHDLWGLDLI